MRKPLLNFLTFAKVSKATLALLLAAQMSVAFAVGCVDPTHPDSRYVIAATTGTVIDGNASAKLMWARCAVGLSGPNCATGAAAPLNWAAANAAASASTLAQYRDWRLPTQAELLSVVAPACSNPAINETAFPATPASTFWSSTEDVNASSNAFVVNFFNGSSFVDAKSNPIYVRLVRAGLPIDPALTTAQTLRFGGAPVLDVGATAPVFATSLSPNSGNALRYASGSPSICSVNAATGVATGVSQGNCVIGVDQYGGVNGGVNYAPAVQVAQSFNVGCEGNRPTVRYVVAADATVVDVATQLMWKQCSENLSGARCDGGSPSVVNWSAATAAAGNSTFAKYNDWRIPTFDELFSLSSLNCALPVINSRVFPGLLPDFYWTSSVVANTPNLVSVIDQYGSGRGSFIDKSESWNTRLVRGAASINPLLPTAQVLTFVAPPVLSVGAAATITATPSVPNSGNPVSYATSSPSICTINAVSGAVTPTAAGVCSIAAMQLGRINNAVHYAPGAASISVPVASAACDLRMNGINALSATKEGLILLRAMLGLKGSAVTDGTGITTPWATLRDQLNRNCGTSFQ